VPDLRLFLLSVVVLLIFKEAEGRQTLLIRSGWAGPLSNLF